MVESAAPAPLRIALFPFTATGNVSENRRTILRAIHRAGADGVDLLLTPECALIGYPGAARADLNDLHSCHLADDEDLLAIEAEKAGINLVLGTASTTESGHWTNDLLIAGADLRPRRYRKQHLTPQDTAFFHPGGSPLTFRLKEWQLAASICFDVRFPSTWQQHLSSGVDGFLCCAHMAGSDPHPPTKSLCVPAHFASRAAENVTPIAFCNTAAADRWLPSTAWDARGLALTCCNQYSVVALPHRSHHGPWYDSIRAKAKQLAEESSRS